MKKETTIEYENYRTNPKRKNKMTMEWKWRHIFGTYFFFLIVLFYYSIYMLR